MRTEDLQSIQSALKANGKVQVFQQYGTCYIRWELCKATGNVGSERVPGTRTAVLDAQGIAFLRKQGCSFILRVDRLCGRIAEEV